MCLKEIGHELATEQQQQKRNCTANKSPSFKNQSYFIQESISEAKVVLF